VPEDGSQSINPTLARGGPKPEPLETLSSSVPSSSLHDSKVGAVGLPPVAKNAAPKMGAVHPQHAARNRTLSLVKVDSITGSSIPPSVDKHHPISSTPLKQDHISVNVCAHLRAEYATTDLNRLLPTFMSMIG
jgi:hypothetical protein